MICSVCHETSKLPRALNTSNTDATYASKTNSLWFLANYYTPWQWGKGETEIEGEKERGGYRWRDDICITTFYVSILKSPIPHRKKMKSCPSWLEASHYEHYNLSKAAETPAPVLIKMGGSLLLKYKHENMSSHLLAAWFQMQHSIYQSSFNHVASMHLSC